MIDTLAPPLEQATLFEMDRRDRSMRRVAKHNRTPSDIAFAEAILRLQKIDSGDEVSSDTLFPELNTYGFTDNRAVGPLMERLRKAGFLMPTDRYRLSSRKGSHRCPRRIYLKP